jgi:hypothetical protein
VEFEEPTVMALFPELLLNHDSAFPLPDISTILRGIPSDSSPLIWGHSL